MIDESTSEPAFRDAERPAIVPGAEEPMRLLAAADRSLINAGIRLAMNASDVVVKLANKEQCFSELQRLGVRIPRTVALADAIDFRTVPLPCVIKPAIESGGSAFAFFARDEQEARLYAEYLNKNGKRPIAQEYITHEFGEFTVGVLSDPSANVLGTVAMKRAFPAKLSILAKGDDFLISSGISQGHIGDYKSVCDAARAISAAVGSKGPLNIQGRVDRDGCFLPFEINPRFSASTYLRALAGFNEIDHFIRLLVGESGLAPLKVEPGWYLRGLTEVIVPEEHLVS